MSTSPRTSFLALASIALGAQLASCGAPPPDERDIAAPDEASTQTAAPTTEPVAPMTLDGTASVTRATRPTRTSIDAPSTVTCEALPNLSDPRNGDVGATRFALSDLTATLNGNPSACSPSRGEGSREVAVRFTAPAAGPWRLSVDSGDAWQWWALSVRDGCEAESALSRCVMYARSMVLPLQEGQTVTLVVGGCYDARSCRVGVRADRIVPSGYAPELSRAAVYRWSPRSFAVVEARDADANAELMVVELRAADGSLVPFGDLPRREVPLQVTRTSSEYQLDLGEIPARAVRARIWAEDAAGLRSAVHDVVIKPRPVLALGERCEDRALESCAPDALCTYERSTGRLCRPRLVAHYDPRGASLRIDLNAAELAMSAAEVTFLDEAGAELARVERFNWINRASSYSIERTPLLARDFWTAPRGLARVRVTVIDAEGRVVTTIEAPVEAPALASWQCDPTTTARVRCGEGLVCVRTTGVWSERSCQTRDPGCPSAWRARPWNPTADVRTATLEGRTETETRDAPACLDESTWSGARLREDVVSFVAPVAGRYRFALASRAPSGVASPDFAIAAHRLDCRVDRPSAAIACRRVEGTTAAPLELTAAAGERVLLLVTARGAALDYRLDVALPNL